MTVEAAPGFLLAEGPDGPVEHLVTGSGEPVTLFVHGLTGSVTQTRPFGSGVRGTKVFPHLRGHGGTPVPASGPGTYSDLAAEVDAVRTATGATRALGVSLGAGALLRLLVDAYRAGAAPPVERVVLALPPAVDVPPDGDPSQPTTLSSRTALADALAAGDAVAVGALLRDQQPDAVRRLPAVGLWARRRAGELAGPPGRALAEVVRAFAGAAPLTPDDRAVLGSLDIRALVLAQEGDDLHPVEAARDLAAAMPAADLVVLPAGGVLWTGRDRLRDVLVGFLDDSE